jgi:hypothetical protein
MTTRRIAGSTKILKLMQMYPDGRATRLMNRLGWPCAHCSARLHEPLSLAAKRHGNPVRPVLACFRALAEGGPSEAQIRAAGRKPRRAKDPLQAWRASAGRYGG